MSFFVLKVGGSIFSHKHERNSLFPDVLDWYADLIARDYAALRGRFILVTGGGAFGHMAVRDAKSAEGEELLALTDAVFLLKSLWAGRLRKRGVPVMPLQLSCFAHADLLGRPAPFADPMHNVLSRGILPILSGDAVLSESQGVAVLGSDRVPQVCQALGYTPLRVVMLTDKSGVFSSGAHGRHLIEYIDPQQPQDALSSLWDNEECDVTSGMRGKLNALIDLAKNGADCIITEGRPAKASFGSIAELALPGSLSIPHTRIALSNTLPC